MQVRPVLCNGTHIQFTQFRTHLALKQLTVRLSRRMSHLIPLSLLCNYYNCVCPITSNSRQIITTLRKAFTNHHHPLFLAMGYAQSHSLSLSTDIYIHVEFVEPKRLESKAANPRCAASVGCWESFVFGVFDSMGATLRLMGTRLHKSK